MIREQYLINFGRCTRVSQRVFCAVAYNAQNVFSIRTRAYNRTYAIMDGSLESAERVHRILSQRKLALCSDCGRVVRAADRFCSVCGAVQHCVPSYRDDMGSM